jgi:hypothetical protein
MMNRLGKFDLVYYTFSLHHWNNPVRGGDRTVSNQHPVSLFLVHDHGYPLRYVFP